VKQIYILIEARSFYVCFKLYVILNIFISIAISGQILKIENRDNVALAVIYWRLHILRTYTRGFYAFNCINCIRLNFLVAGWEHRQSSCQLPCRVLSLATITRIVGIFKLIEESRPWWTSYMYLSYSIRLLKMSKDWNNDEETFWKRVCILEHLK